MISPGHPHLPADTPSGAYDAPVSRSRSLFRFSVWVTSTKRYWVILAKHRSFVHPHRPSVGQMADETEQGPARLRKSLARQDPFHTLDTNAPYQCIRVHSSRLGHRMHGAPVNRPARAISHCVVAACILALTVARTGAAAPETFKLSGRLRGSSGKNVVYVALWQADS